MRETVPFPPSCFIEVTTRCNIACRICGQAIYPCARGDMSPEIFNKLEPLFSRTKSVSLFGAGEPLLHPDFLDMLQRVKSLGNYVNTVTNGVLLDQTTCDKIISAGLDSLSVSMDGACAATFNYIRRGADFDAVIANVRRLVDTRNARGGKIPRIGFILVVTKLNVAEIPDLVRLAKDLGIEEVTIASLIEWDRIKDPKLKPPKNGAEHIEEAKALAHELGIDFVIQGGLEQRLEQKIKDRREAGIPGKPPQGLRRKMCTDPWHTVRIAFNGDIWPCCLPSRCLGCIREDDFAINWNRDEYNTFRKLLKSANPSPECVRCGARQWSDPIPSKLDITGTIYGQLGTGWYEKEKTSQGLEYRWMGKSASFYLNHRGNRKLQLRLFSNRACLTPNLALDVYIRDELVRRISLKKAGLQKVKVPLARIPEGLIEVKLVATHSFVPARHTPGNSDGRELSIALCEAQLKG